MTTTRVEDVVRPLVPVVLGSLVRRFGHFDACEDAVQEALLAAVRQWPSQGVPDNPRGWLVTVATRRLTDMLRSDASRRRREDRTFVLRSTEPDASGAVASEREPVGDRDDTLRLLFLCCHPDLSPPSQLALTLRAVGGLTTAEIAAACFVPETTMGQRISRAKQRLKASELPFRMPPAPELADRLRVVLQVLYLVFNEGYVATSGAELQRADLTAEAIRLTRELHRSLPADGEVAGLLALMVLTDARRAARTAPDGSMIPIDEQDRTRWDRAAIAEGVELITGALAAGPLGPYQIQAAIAAVHDEAPTADDTDWPEILALYGLLEQVQPNPMVTLNKAVALAMVEGPEAGLAVVDALATDGRLAEHHRRLAVRAHLLELAGDDDRARAAYRDAARRTTSIPEQRYLDGRARRLG
jgi:RNA polymerase sigma factor (sigma-70 family)